MLTSVYCAVAVGTEKPEKEVKIREALVKNDPSLGPVQYHDVYSAGEYYSVPDDLSLELAERWIGFGYMIDGNDMDAIERSIHEEQERQAAIAHAHREHELEEEEDE